MLVNVNFKIVYRYSHHAQFMLSFRQKNDTAHVSYTKVSIFVHVVFNYMSANLQYK